MKLSIIIPVYNEEGTILRVIARVRAVALNCADFEREIIVVDDASTDRTRALLAGVQNERDIVLVCHGRNGGKGAAVRTGLQYASGNVILIQDADLEYDPSDYPRLLRPILDGEVQVAYGSRFLGGCPAGMSIFHVIGNRFLTGTANRLHQCSLTDVLTCYKAFTREVAAQLDLRSMKWDVDAEITAQILGHGYAIHETPISYHGRTLREGKKIRWWAGLSILRTLVKHWRPTEVKVHRRTVLPAECVTTGEVHGHPQPQLLEPAPQ
jgi:glycosyltransferase involved in cell wall biosynthesis